MDGLYAFEVVDVDIPSTDEDQGRNRSIMYNQGCISIVRIMNWKQNTGTI